MSVFSTVLFLMCVVSSEHILTNEISCLCKLGFPSAVIQIDDRPSTDAAQSHLTSSASHLASALYPISTQIDAEINGCDNIINETVCVNQRFDGLRKYGE